MNKIDVVRQINKITSNLIAVNLSEEQYFPSDVNGIIYISGAHDLSLALKNIPYSDIYSTLKKDKNYNIQMVDGALIQFMYVFDSDDNLCKSRLSFFPSPNLEEFQNNSELYELDDIYADMINKNIITIPIRFDYDPTNFIPKEHPSSHLTLGQYKNCRIPVCAPLSPNVFIDFILRNFYHTARNKYAEELNFNINEGFANTINDVEKQILHLSICH